MMGPGGPLSGVQHTPRPKEKDKQKDEKDKGKDKTSDKTGGAQ
jgi:hypothetical protein